MSARELVGYDYIAAGLGVKIETAQIYALKRNAKRFPDYPRRVNPGQRSPLFRRTDADRFIANHPPRPRDGADTTNHRDVETIRLNLDNAVDYAYIAERLNISKKTAYVYGTPTSTRRLPGFPTPITPPRARTPLFDKSAVDKYIRDRIDNARSARGRVRAAAVDDTAAGIASQAAEILGRPVDLENRAQLRQILFTELGLPPTRSSARGPSVSTAALVQLHKTDPHPFLGCVLKYRGAAVPESDPGAAD